MVYLDSNVFVYSVTHDPAKSEKARDAIRILREVEEGETRGVTSILTWDELAWVVWKLEGREAGTKAAASFLRLQNLTLMTISFATVLRAQELVERYQLKPRDAIHISTALTAGEKEIISDDVELDAVREVRRVPLGRNSRTHS
jgi:predicted nucleic acid-binding protein